MFDSKTGPYGIFVLRVALGIMFIAHGATKYFVFKQAGTAAFFSSIGFPGWIAYPVIAFEIFGGIMLIIGVIPRLIGLVATVLLFAAATVHFGNGWRFDNAGGGWEYPVYLSVTTFVLALLSDGPLALVKSSSLLRLIRKS